MQENKSIAECVTWSDYKGEEEEMKRIPSG